MKAVKGPCPWVSIMPTGGVESTEASLKAWFDAGVACVGMGSNLITKELLKAGDYDGIAAKVQGHAGADPQDPGRKVAMALNIKPREQCQWDAAALGEVMLRLDPGDGRIRTTRSSRCGRAAASTTSCAACAAASACAPPW